MPRTQSVRPPLSQLLAALVGAASGVQLIAGLAVVQKMLALNALMDSFLLDAGPQAAAFAVCEFSCSCCKSSTSLAADALCTFLLDDASALHEFCCNSDGLSALQVISRYSMECSMLALAGCNACMHVCLW